MRGGNSSYGVCEFLLSWSVKRGTYDGIDLSNLNVGLAGRYRDSDPQQLWHVILYVDDRGSQTQRKCLEEIFLGRAGGSTYRNYAQAISEVYAVRPARIELIHAKKHESIRIGPSILAQTLRVVNSETSVSCGIPGHDHPGQEVVAEKFRVKDAPFDFEFEGRCGFATNFSYVSD